MSSSFRVPTCYQHRPIQFPVAELSSNFAHKSFVGSGHHSCYQHRPIQFPVAELSSNSATNSVAKSVINFFRLIRLSTLMSTPPSFAARHNCFHQLWCQFFSPSIRLPTLLSVSYRHQLWQQPERWFWKRNQSAVLLPTSLIKAAKVIANTSNFAD